MSTAAAAPGGRSSLGPLHGVTLEQYAGIMAGLADEFPLDALLVNEDLAPEDWCIAAVAWKQRLVTDGPDEELFKTFVSRQAEAEDWLSRPITPLDDELGAWLGFLHAFSAHPSPFELLARAGLRMNDMARLQRRWSRRLEADPGLREQAAAILKDGVGPLPPIKVGSAELRPFPWSKGRALTQASTGKVSDPSGGASELPLDRYAAIMAELAEPNAEGLSVLEKHGLGQAAFSKLDVAWNHRLRDDAGLERDYRRLFEHQRARICSSAARAEPTPVAHAAAVGDLSEQAPPPPAPAVSSPLTGTAPLLDVPRGPVIPFVEGTSTPEIAAPSGLESTVAQARPWLPETALAIEVPREPALPFVGAADAVIAPRPAKLTGTSPVVEVSRGSVLPFTPSTEGSAPSEIAQASSDPPPKRGLAGRRDTGPAVELRGGQALPFAAPSPPVDAVSARKPNPLSELSLDFRIPENLPPPRHPAPSAVPTAPVHAAPPLTLEQHASLCVELACAPERIAETFVRYRITKAQKKLADDHFRERFSKEPGLYAIWSHAYQTYRAWFLTHRA